MSAAPESLRLPAARLSSEQQEEVQRLTREVLRKAERIFNCPFPSIPVRFDLTGRAAGMYCQRNNSGFGCWIRYNPQVFAADFAHHCKDTVPHEVAHYVTRLLHPSAKGHGPEWKRVARLLGAAPKATGNYSLEGVAVRRQRRHVYVCDCQTHQLTTLRHNRAQKGARFVCRKCRGTLHPALDVAE